MKANPDFFIRDILKPFYDILGNESFSIMEKILNSAKKKYKKEIQSINLSEINSKLIFNSSVNDNRKKEVFKYVYSLFLNESKKKIGNVAEHMIKFAVEDYLI